MGKTDGDGALGLGARGGKETGPPLTIIHHPNSDNPSLTVPGRAFTRLRLELYLAKHCVQ